MGNVQGMKILISHSTGRKPLYGGAEHVIVKFCEYLRNHNIEHAVSLPNMTEGMKADLQDTPVVSFSQYKSYDLINFHNFPATLQAGMVIGKPMVHYSNEPAELFTSWERKPIEAVNRYLIKNVIKNILVADKYNAKRFFDIYKVVPQIIPYGIDYEFFSQAEHKPDDKYFTVIQVGTISRYKNQLATVQAIAAIKERVHNVRLWLVGEVREADYKIEIETAISKSGLGGKVEFIPHCSREHLRHLYGLADVCLHPVKEQGGWLTPFEAISARVPVITSKDITCRDMIDQHNLAMTTLDDNLPIWLYQFYQRYEVFEDVTLKARQWVADNLTWDRFGESMIKYFNEVLDCQKYLSLVSRVF